MPAHAKSNPFHQPARQWQIRIFAPIAETDAIEEAFVDLALATSRFETEEDSQEWYVEILTATPPEESDIESRLALVAGLLDTPTRSFAITPLDAKDWVSEVQKSFPPLHVGKFYVYGSHVETPPPSSKIALKVNAGAAFGSGEHATTSGCLIALGLLARRKHFNNPLDMGCGSGILALAAAKLWHVPVMGVDIDPVSVTVACENARTNHLHGLTRFAAGDGYHTPLVRQNGPFDLIIANILARPLMRMAPQLARHLAPGGTVVLSGLLGSQERMVLAAHRAQGLHLKSRIVIGHWNTLILR